MKLKEKSKSLKGGSVNNWNNMLIGKAINFNPPETIKKGEVSKKIPMGMLTEFQRNINGYELSVYKSGPKFKNNDVLMAKITPCLENGKTALCNILIEDETAFGSSEFIVLRETEYTTSKYIYYFAISPTFRKRAISCMEGTSGRKRVNENTLKYFELPFPDIDEQQKISKVLSDLDSKIELNNKINAELESMAKLLYDYWFVQFDFPDENGKPYKSSGGKMVYSEELKREIPEGWGVGTFADIIESIESGYRPKGGIKSIDKGVPSIGAENILSIGNYNYTQEKLIPKDFYDNMTQGIVHDNDVLMYKDGASLGRVAMFKCGFPYKRCAINSHAFIVRSNHKISQNFLYFWLDQNYIKEIIKRLGMKAAQPGINQANVKILPILIPNIDVIRKFDMLINPSIDTIFKNANQNRKLSLNRDFLLPMLMNGQVRVKIVNDKNE
jgi:type I restriction enzyme S subunit